MSTFRTEHAVRFGSRLAPPVGARPREAEFVAGRTTAGEAFCLRWWPDPDAVGYHIFRSQSVSQIRERSMDRLWQGHYRDEVMHFIIGDDEVGLVVDDYRVRGASMMFYWVLVQDRAGGLRVLRGLTVCTATDDVLAEPHFLLAPSGGGWQDGAPEDDEDEPIEVDAIEDAPEDPAMVTAVPRAREVEVQRPQLRQVAWARYRPPATLRIVHDGGPVHHFSVYIGPDRARDEAADALWDDDHFEDNPMARYDLPAGHTCFTDRLHPAGTECYVAVMVVRPDGTVAGQAKIGLVERGAAGPVAVLV